MLVAVDMALHRVQAYRHALFNRLSYSNSRIPVRQLRTHLYGPALIALRVRGSRVQTSVAVMALALVAVGAFEQAADQQPGAAWPRGADAQAAERWPRHMDRRVAEQFVLTFAMTALHALVFAATVVAAACALGVGSLPTRSSTSSPARGDRGSAAVSYSRLVVALVLSSFGKFLCVGGAWARIHGTSKPGLTIAVCGTLQVHACGCVGVPGSRVRLRRCRVRVHVQRRRREGVRACSHTLYQVCAGGGGRLRSRRRGARGPVCVTRDRRSYQ